MAQIANLSLEEAALRWLEAETCFSQLLEYNSQVAHVFSRDLPGDHDVVNVDQTGRLLDSSQNEVH